MHCEEQNSTATKSWSYFPAVFSAIAFLVGLHLGERAVCWFFPLKAGGSSISNREEHELGITKYQGTSHFRPSQSLLLP